MSSLIPKLVIHFRLELQLAPAEKRLFSIEATKCAISAGLVWRAEKTDDWDYTYLLPLFPFLCFVIPCRPPRPYFAANAYEETRLTSSAAHWCKRAHHWSLSISDCFHAHTQKKREALHQHSLINAPQEEVRYVICWCVVHFVFFFIRIFVSKRQRKFKSPHDFPGRFAVLHALWTIAEEPRTQYHFYSPKAIENTRAGLFWNLLHSVQ